MATGTTSRISTPAFHADDPEQTTEYRSLSGLAIIGLILGLLSPLCFGAVLLMAIPIVGIAISILALRQIAASEGGLAGRMAALVGLILCIVFVVAPIARSTVLRVTRTHQAEQFSRSWIDVLLAGKTERAFRLTTDSVRPPSMPEPGMPAPKLSPYETFAALPIVQSLAAAGADADVRFDGTELYDSPSFQRVVIRQRFEIIPNSTKGDAHPIEALITLQRATLSKENRSRWLIGTVEDAKNPTARPPR